MVDEVTLMSCRVTFEPSVSGERSEHNAYCNYLALRFPRVLRKFDEVNKFR